MPTEDEDFSTYSFGWWVYYGTFKATGQTAFLFNVKADSKTSADDFVANLASLSS